MNKKRLNASDIRTKKKPAARKSDQRHEEAVSGTRKQSAANGLPTRVNNPTDEAKKDDVCSRTDLFVGGMRTTEEGVDGSDRVTVGSPLGHRWVTAGSRHTQQRNSESHAEAKSLLFAARSRSARNREDTIARR